MKRIYSCLFVRISGVSMFVLPSVKGMRIKRLIRGNTSQIQTDSSLCSVVPYITILLFFPPFISTVSVRCSYKFYQLKSLIKPLNVCNTCTKKTNFELLLSRWRDKYGHLEPFSTFKYLCEIRSEAKGNKRRRLKPPVLICSPSRW